VWYLLGWGAQNSLANGCGTCYIACVMCHGEDGLTPAEKSCRCSHAIREHKEAIQARKAPDFGAFFRLMWTTVDPGAPSNVMAGRDVRRSGAPS